MGFTVGLIVGFTVGCTVGFTVGSVRFKRYLVMVMLVLMMMVMVRLILFFNTREGTRIPCRRGALRFRADAALCSICVHIPSSAL